MKNWKHLFVKSDEQEGTGIPPTEAYGFPLNTPVSDSNSPPASINEQTLNEVISVYEKGVDSINMPGYDFFDFYKAISSVNLHGEQTYSMAFRMAQSMDNKLTVGKLLSDAEFYISKIDEVHKQYSLQGQHKLSSLESKKNDEKNRLIADIDQGVAHVEQLRSQLQSLETEISQKRAKLTAIDTEFQPKEAAIRQKLLANDSARQISISKLNAVKEGIQKHIK